MTALSLKQIACVVHEANRALRTGQVDLGIPVSVPWDDLGGETRICVIDGGKAVQGGASSWESHENWSRFKVAYGWNLDPVRDKAMK